MFAVDLICLTIALRDDKALEVNGKLVLWNHTATVAQPRLKIPVATWRARAIIVQDGFTPGAVGNKLESAT